ncbi:formylglycine-generating enzyme family protein [Acinetobacter nosocomialis]|uniref:formylglycine-generating enzyme family protein n=1 Tax=Acinetobacter nosocomialis TaxID=106654 RepID=UPI001ADC394E|nr:formylglycine-generating enzyme family protein [Acinetobacter nosocomialis]MBO8208706.1 formylglycine-generating enzyme family protein [Acinetobacter nosocomialis]MBO8214509.1 formylglycine-generating enzyme family protein [Acinetobacter nosocomialis]MBO8225157.1 formylglycine-generating enzyme family protein [Acinetobacter nosocomialis]MBO8249534.1 formylglycine-generating enzyme family protein [Acinetobacter nosocomialis]
MNIISSNYSKGFGILIISLLSACNNDDKDTTINSKNQKLLEETITSLENLKQTLVWQENQCDSVYSKVIGEATVAQKSTAELRANIASSNNLGVFLDNQIIPKLAQLTDESTVLRARCNAPDYDGTGVSIERPAMLREMLSEWKGTINLLIRQINNPPNMNPEIKLASLTNININQLTAAKSKFKDCSDSFCPEMTVIPAGSFLMGGNINEQEQQNVPAQSRPYELPQHLVQVEKPFAMSTYETTIAEFQAFQKETGWEVEGCRNWETRNGVFNMWYRDDLNPNNSGMNQTPQDPVVCVRREDGREFAKWLSKKTGQTYRLPTEVEWEYAARAGTTTAYYWGDDLNLDQACKYANVLDPATVVALPQTSGWSLFNCTDGYPFTSPVGKFLPNNFGLYDMSANAREWVDDCWHANYENAPSVNRRWGEENNGQCNFPVLRGGAWIYNTYNVRTAYRNAYVTSQARSIMWGFRLVREI